jgi:ribosomal protein S27AE
LRARSYTLCPTSLSLTCPTCGGKLQITNNIERFACGYCGNEHLVRRSGGIVTIEPVIEGLKKIQEGTDKTASELAIRRLQEEISNLNVEILQLKEQSVMKAGSNIPPGDVFLIYDLIHEASKKRSGMFSMHKKLSWLTGDPQEAIHAIATATDEEIEEAINLALSKKKSPNTVNRIQQILSSRRKLEQKFMERDNYFKQKQEELKQKREELKYHEATIQRQYT